MATSRTANPEFAGHERWCRSPGSKLIAAGGGSAEHIAAAAAVIPRLDEPGENQAISSIPNALGLFNPVILLAPVADDKELTQVATHHVSKNNPPTIILHSRAEITQP